MLRRIQRGAAVGVGFGACLATACLLVATVFFRRFMMHPPEPVSMATVGVMAWTVLLSAALGGLGGAALARRPGLLPHLLPAPFVALALGAPSYPIAQLSAVALAWLGYVVLAAAWRRWPRVTGLVVVGAGLLLARALRVEDPPRGEAATATPPEGAPNVLWVVFDTARADHLPTGGYPRDTAPRLAALAAESLVFERAYAPSPWTLPSHASMLTGVNPSRHGAHDQHLYLDGALPTVAELLARRGWDTGLLASNVWVGDATGLGRGFHRVVAAWRATMVADWFPTSALLRPWLARDKGAAAVDDAFAAWLDERPADRPFLAFVNYLEAHVPYHEIAPSDRDLFVSDAEEALGASERYTRYLYAAPDGPGPTPSERDLLVALYDAGIRSDDRHLGVLLDQLDTRGLLDGTIIIVTSDHGESFGEGGRWEHHLHASEENLRVPLVLRMPGLPAGRVPTPVSLVDLMPTVLDAVGLSQDTPSDLDGRSLLALVRGAAETERPLFAEAFAPNSKVLSRRVAALGYEPASFRWWSVSLGPLRLVRDPRGERLLDVVADPAGERDLSTEKPEARDALRALLDAYVEGGGTVSGQAPALDDAARDQLRRLGYIE